MPFIRVTIAVLGLTEAEVSAGLPDLLDEFRHRHWLANPSASWDVVRRGLIVTIDYEGRDTKLCGRAVLDEVRDCVVACLQFSSDIHFAILDSSYAPVA
jgi:hypothetical protein